MTNLQKKKAERAANRMIRAIVEGMTVQLANEYYVGMLSNPKACQSLLVFLAGMDFLCYKGNIYERNPIFNKAFLKAARLIAYQFCARRIEAATARARRA